MTGKRATLALAGGGGGRVVQCIGRCSLARQGRVYLVKSGGCQIMRGGSSSRASSDGPHALRRSTLNTSKREHVAESVCLKKHATAPGHATV